MPLDIQTADLVTIGLLILIEGLLSADNALVLAILVLGLPRDQQQRALRYGIIGAFAFRALAVALAAYLIRVAWVKLGGAAYLLYLAVKHFAQGERDERHRTPPAKPGFGLSAFWATVVRVELVDIAFSIDSILVAVALSDKLWVIVTGGILGIITMRLVAGRFIALIRRYPAIVDGAFVIIGWIGIKLLLEYAHQIGWVGFELPKWLSLGLIVVIFAVSFLLARMQARRTPAQDESDPPADLH